MKKLMTAVVFAAAMTAPLAASAASMSETEKAMAQQANTKGVWIDVRSAEEFNAGHLQNAINIPHEQILDRIQAVSPDKDAPINLYCRSGRRAEVALNALKKAGYTNVTNHGGYEDLVKKGMK
ncbi:rhodanese-like domain-containing protein [uncultured Aggregatibacter sp.]|uniref:rhodanese-like domain-containing protein n=1 Tax=uncultured Aggregatibacter sp. TaxID=470564 RepID=UPI002616C65D|nr:rhodanese-like domain-containing protein [uncultured Aggregatibacter sp.]